MDEQIDLGTIWNDKRVEEPGEGDQRASLSLLMFATNLFAGLASESMLIRRHMGIRKVLFG